MKKLSLLFLAAMLCVSACACKLTVKPAETETVEYTVTWALEESDEPVENGYFYVYYGDENVTAYAVNIDDVDITEGALSVLVYLNENYDVPLSYSASAYGAFLTGFGSLSAEGNAFIALYTTNADDQNVPGEYTKELNIDGKSFVTAGVGVSSMHVIGGESVYLTLETF